MEAMKGLLILFVLISHAVVSVYRDLTFLLPVLRFVSPCVFVFVYLFGYSQGRMRKSPLKIIRKSFFFFLFYLFWSSVSFFLYSLLDGRYSKVWVTKQVFSVDGTLLSKYLITIFSFTGSWQYYFVFVFIMLMVISVFIKDPRKIFPFSLVGAILSSSFVSVWFLTKDELLPPVEGAFITYFNPVHWLFPFLLGHKDVLERRERSLKKHSLAVYLALFGLGSLEYWNAYRKFRSLIGIDQFSLPGVLLGVYSVEVFSSVSKKLSFPLLKRMGRYSFLLFMIHMPFQWMFYVFLDTLIDLPEWCWVLIMIAFSIAFMECLLRFAKHLPKPLRKVVIGL